MNLKSIKISRVLQISIIISILLSLISIYFYGFGVYEVNNILGNVLYTLIYGLFYFFIVLFFARFIIDYKLIKSIITVLVATIICAILYFISGDLLSNPNIIYGESTTSNFEAFATSSYLIYIYVFSAMIFIIFKFIKTKTITTINILMLVFLILQVSSYILDLFFI